MPKKTAKVKVTNGFLKPTPHHRHRWSLIVPAFSFLLLIFAIALAIYVRYFAYTLTQYDTSTNVSDVSSGSGSSGSSSGVVAPETKTGSGVSTPLVVKTGNFVVTVKSASDAVQQVTDIATKMKGSVVSSTVSDSSTSCNGGVMPMYYSEKSAIYSYSCYDAVITIRVPAASYDDTRAALQKIDENAKFDSETSQAVDVTTQASDLQTQLDSYESEQASLQKLLESAENVDDILKIRTELTQVTTQVQSLQQQIRDINKNVQYSELTVSITKLADQQTSAPSVSGRFSMAWAAMRQDMNNIGTAFIFLAVYAIIYIPVLLLLGIVYWLVKRAIHRRRK